MASMLKTPEKSSSDSDERSRDATAGRPLKRPRLELEMASERDSIPEKEAVTIRQKKCSAQQDDLAKNGYITLSEQVHDIERFTPHIANAASLARIRRGHRCSGQGPPRSQQAAASCRFIASVGER